jgi:hypothetical protein
MENYKGFLIEEIALPVENYTNLLNMQTIKTHEWVVRIINPATAKIKTVNTVEQAKLLIDNWTQYGVPADLAELRKQIKEKQYQLQEFDLEMNKTVDELKAKRQEKSQEIANLRARLPDDDFFRE